ncbi:hypothetical protein D9M68_884520 [compost metagenome]
MQERNCRLKAGGNVDRRAFAADVAVIGGSLAGDEEHPLDTARSVQSAVIAQDHRVLPQCRLPIGQ